MKDDKKLEAPSKKRVPIKFRKGEDDGTGRLAMEDVYGSAYKMHTYTDPETGQTKTRKVRAHRIDFKNSRMGAKPEITEEEKMKKTFSQFKEDYALDEAKFAKGGIPSAPNTGNKDDGYTKRQRQRAAKKRAEELTKQRREREMKEELNLEDFSLEEIEEFMMSEEFEQLDELSKQRLGQYIRLASRDASRAAQSAELHKRTGDEAYSKLAKAAQRKRQAGIDKATHRLAKEDYAAQDALEYLFSLDEETFQYMMEEHGLDASVEIILTRMNEGLQDDILAVAKTISPNARVRPSVADQIKKREEMMKSKPQPKGGSEKPYEKYPLGGYDPVSRRSYSD